MTLQAAIEAQLPFLRAEAESRMTSTATVRRKTSRTVQDESTGREVPVWDDVAVDLPFRLGKSRDGATRTITTAAGEVQAALRVGHFPEDEGPFRDGDLVDITSGRNAGGVWQIVEADHGDQQTAYRVPLISAARPGEWA